MKSIRSVNAASFEHDAIPTLLNMFHRDGFKVETVKHIGNLRDDRLELVHFLAKVFIPWMSPAIGAQFVLECLKELEVEWNRMTALDD